MKTIAAVLYEQNRPLVVEDLEVPSLKNGQVLVEIIYSGICQTQLNEYRGRKGADPYLPHLLGHEASGHVRETKGVNKVGNGDYVVLSWIKGSGANVPSSEYTDSKGRKINAGAVTTFQKYSVVSENRVTKIDSMPSDVASLLGCAVPTGAGILLHKINPKNKESLAIFGLGGIGSSALLMASHTSGLEKIIAVDVNDEKLKLAGELGANYTINAREEDVVKKIYGITSGEGVDYAIEASGVREAMEQAYNSANKNHGKVILSGNLGGGRCIEIDPYHLLFGKTLTGTGEHNTNPDADFPVYRNLYINNKIPFDKLVSRKYGLEQINEALENLSRGEVFRSLIDFS